MYVGGGCQNLAVHVLFDNIHCRNSAVVSVTGEITGAHYGGNYGGTVRANMTNQHYGKLAGELGSWPMKA